MINLKKLLPALLVITTLMIAGCVKKTPLSEENKIYAGKWITTDGTWIHIYNDGGGSFQTSNSSVTGGSAVVTDSTVQIGLMGLNGTYHIDKAPYEENGVWKMQLDGNIYIKE